VGAAVVPVEQAVPTSTSMLTPINARTRSRCGRQVPC
jgi:hypothetical protein